MNFAKKQVSLWALTVCLTTLAHADHTVTVTAGKTDLPPTPITAVLPADLADKSVKLIDKDSGEAVVTQSDKSAGKPAVTWILPSLKAGSSKTYSLSEGQAPTPATGEGVVVEKGEKGLDVKIDGELFTTYIPDGPYKPYWWPMNGPTGKPITRAFPMIKGLKGEMPDHHHHRSFWFTHGSVNGTDFWSETPKAGKTVNREIKTVTSGPVFGEFVAIVDWKDLAGKKVCEDERRFRVYRVPDGRLFDFGVDVKATDGPVTFGDTKEGMFGFRVAGSMNWLQLVKGRPKGTLVNSEGAQDKAVWGKPAKWCDYYGPLEGEIAGIAMFDNPSNLRHPTTWHARDYGLYCANPFGLSDFTGDKTKDGAYTIPEGKAMNLLYRIYMHKGDTASAHVADHYAAYAEPPKVEVQ